MLCTNRKDCYIKSLAVFFIILLLAFSLTLYGNVWVLHRGLSSVRSTGNETGSKPEAVHIAFGRSPSTEMVISWASLQRGHSYVMYGTKSNNLPLSVNSEYDMFTETNHYGMQHMYRAQLTGLQPDTEYYYRVHSGNRFQSVVYKFRTVPEKAQVGRWMPSFLVYGDLGLHTKRLDSIINQGLTQKYDAVLHLGDIGYNLFNMKGMVGDQFQRRMELLAAQLPYLTTPGDHESPHHFTHYRHRFSMPGVPWPMPVERLWFSLDIGNVHLISYDTEVFFHQPRVRTIEKQFQWLVADLEKASKNRLQVPWIVVIGHKPLYCSQVFPQDCNIKHSKVRDGVEELFYTFGVDLVLQGHCHSYERFWPVYKGKVLAMNYNNPRAPTYIITGTTGNQYITDTISPQVRKEWSAFLMSKTSDESVGRLRILNDTHLTWQEVLTVNWTVIDEFTLIKDVHGPNADVEQYLQRALSDQSLANTLLGQNLALAKGDFTGLRMQFKVVMILAFAFVVVLFLFRATVIEFMESLVHRVKYLCRENLHNLEYTRQNKAIV